MRATSLAGLALGALTGSQDPAAPARQRWVLPCERYEAGLRGQGNFGVRVAAKSSPFFDTWHLAEDVWLPTGTEVRAVAEGVVRWSDFSPTWVDEHGRAHWNLGNAIVIEHRLDPPLDEAGSEEPLAAACSLYVHLAADRLVAVGDRVTAGQPIGHIGADRSDENGRYPAHLHFGLHRGPYVQVHPSLARELRAAAGSEQGLRFGDTVLRGELELRLSGETSVLVTAVATGESALLSLLAGSTAPVDPPADIMGWCRGYGDEQAVAEWLRPSALLRDLRRETREL